METNFCHAIWSWMQQRNYLCMKSTESSFIILNPVSSNISLLHTIYSDPFMRLNKFHRNNDFRNTSRVGSRLPRYSNYILLPCVDMKSFSWGVSCLFVDHVRFIWSLKIFPPFYTFRQIRTWNGSSFKSLSL